MKTLKNCPELMDKIINIQLMKKKINTDYNSIKDFKRLEKMTDNELWDEQINLITEYNYTFKRNPTIIKTEQNEN